MKLFIPLLSAIVFGCATSTPSDNQVPRQTLSFDEGWRFARFGLQADGSRVDEPGMAKPLFRLSASSEETGKGNLAALAMDGDPETRWCASGPAGGQWVQVDLGAAVAVAKADIAWESEGNYQGVVEGSADGNEWKPLPATVRFVRVKVTAVPGGKWASIREIKLTGADGKALANRLTNTGATPAGPTFADTAWRKLDLPHDWAIEGPFRFDLEGNTGKLPWQGIGWYRKAFTIPAADAGRRIFIDFDGAMAHAQVYCNGKLAGGWPYGYASFRVELTSHLNFGQENVLAVRLDTEKVGSRWYPGAGIYRHVRLEKTDPVHIAHWGVFVTTPELTEAQGTAKLAVSVDNQAAAPVKAVIKAEIRELAPDGAPGAIVAQSQEQAVEIAAGATGETTLTATVATPKRWNVWNAGDGKANRYLARTTVAVDGKIVDMQETPFGFRTIEFTHDDGFHLNGKRVQIQGVCNHHDLGALGAAVNRRATERQLEVLKGFGCNAIRTSHNPPSPELVEAADRLGFLIMDEAFDCWTRTKRGGDYSSLYKEWNEKDIEMLVKRDRNHPSVILWSTGNECEEQYSPEIGIVRHLTGTVHRFDTTRPATFGASWPGKSAMNGTELQVDVHGMNYAPGCYGGPDFYVKFLAKPGHEKLAGYSSESASTISSRGEYFFPGEPSTPWQVSSYDLRQPGWGSLPDEEFAALDRAPGMCGEFVWTGFDYLGEPTPYNSDTTNLLNVHGDAKKLEEMKAELERIKKSRAPSRSSYFGIVDLAGFPKDRYWLYQARWRPDLPMAHILPHWNWPGREGKTTPVFVYTSGDEAELFLNGQSQGRRQKGKLEYRLRWNEVKYQPGELKVVAYKNGKEWATETIKTTGAPTKLALTPDRAEIKADGEDLSFITLRIADQDGLTVPRSNPLVKFSVEGPGEIVATDNGDATSFESFQSPDRHAFNGLALVIVRAKKGAGGTITVKAASDGLAGAAARLQAKGNSAGGF